MTLSAGPDGTVQVEELPLEEGEITLPEMFFRARLVSNGIIEGGFEFVDDTILLHPPPVGAPPATLEFRGVEFAGERTLSLIAGVENPHSGEVVLSVTVWTDQAVALAMSMNIPPGGKSEARAVASRPLLGQHRVTISSRMQNGSASHEYAWLRIRHLGFS
jgi:hypothetical protein